MTEERKKIEAIDCYLMALEYAWTAYFFYYNCISNPLIRNQVSDVRFEKNSQIDSMIIELGWAFFVRMEAPLEVLIKKLDAKKVNDLLGVDKFNSDERNGLDLYREIRNTLHHGDGDPALLRKQPCHLRVEWGKEPHLMYEHMKNFYELFKKIGLKLKKRYEE